MKVREYTLYNDLTYPESHCLTKPCKAYVIFPNPQSFISSNFVPEMLFISKYILVVTLGIQRIKMRRKICSSIPEPWSEAPDEYGDGHKVIEVEEDAENVGCFLIDIEALYPKGLDNLEILS